MANKTYHSEPGVYIYDTFDYPDNENMFMTVIYAEIDPLQYWRDRPLLLNRAVPITAEAVNMTSIGLAELTGNETVIQSIEEVVELGEVLEEQEKEVHSVIEEIKNIETDVISYYQREWIAADGQFIFPGTYSTDFIIVVVDGVELNSKEYTANDNVYLILNTPARKEQVVQLHFGGLLPDSDLISNVEYYQSEWIATNGQTIFPGTYSTNFIIVAVDGVELNSKEYTAIDNTNLVLNNPTRKNQTVQLHSSDVKSYQSEWIAIDDQTIFPGTYSTDFIIVVIDGIELNSKEYTAVDNTNLVLNNPTRKNQIVQLHSFGLPTQETTSISGYTTVVSSVETSSSVSDTSTIIISEDIVIERLGILEVATEFEDLVVDYISTYKPVIDQIKAIEEAIPEQGRPENQAARVKIVEDSWKPLGELSDQWYGIPLINVGPKDTPTGDSFLVNINSKNDWNVSVTNVITTGIERDILTIDRQIPPGKKFMVGFYTMENKFGLILRIQGDPKIYQKELSTFNQSGLIPKAISYGVDNQFIKSLNGHMWDILFWEQPSNFNHNIPATEPQYPKGGWIYDFRKTGLNNEKTGGTIDGNTIRSIYDYGPSARVGSGPNNSDGQFIHLEPIQENIVTGFPGIHPWYFIYNTYMDNFFCRAHLKQDSFTLNWFQWLPQYPTGICNWISDSIFSNYLSYDYDNFRFQLEFNGRRYQETITLPNQIWAGFSLRYNKITGDLVFAFRDIKYRVIEKIIFNIGTDLKFELISLFGRYDKEEKEYVESHQAVMGMVMIYEEYRTDQEVLDICDEVSDYLTQYEPSLDQILLEGGSF